LHEAIPKHKNIVKGVKAALDGREHCGKSGD
jgi:hypothetical protein